MTGASVGGGTSSTSNPSNSGVNNNSSFTSGGSSSRDSVGSVGSVDSVSASQRAQRPTVTAIDNGKSVKTSPGEQVRAMIGVDPRARMMKEARKRRQQNRQKQI